MPTLLDTGTSEATNCIRGEPGQSLAHSTHVVFLIAFKVWLTRGPPRSRRRICRGRHISTEEGDGMFNHFPKQAFLLHKEGRQTIPKMNNAAHSRAFTATTPASATTPREARGTRATVLAHPSNRRSVLCFTAHCSKLYVNALKGSIEARSSRYVDTCCQEEVSNTTQAHLAQAEILLQSTRTAM